MKSQIIIDENGQKQYKKICPRCRKTYVTLVPSTRYCSEACHEAYLKRRKAKGKSCKTYQKKHSVSRALEASSRSFARKTMMYLWPCVDALTGDKLDSWDLLQCHHLNLDPLSDSVTNLVPLTALSHSLLHQKIRHEFGKEIEDKLYQFGRGVFNFSSLEEYLSLVKLREEVVAFQLSQLKLPFGVPLPEYDNA